MHHLRDVLFGLSGLLAAASCCPSASAAESPVDAPRAQACSASVLRAVGAFLKVDAFELPAANRGADADAVIVSAACRASPAARQTTIAAIAYRSSHEDAKALVVALVDTATGKVIASHQDEIVEDAGMRIEAESLKVDTAPYVLAKGVRAFGVDVTSGYIPHCGDGGEGATRTLYVQEGTALRPVLGLTMSYWTFLQQGLSRCTTSDAPETTVIEQIDLSIALGAASTHGYRDLQVTATSTRDDTHARTKKPVRFGLKYDGRAYDARSVQNGDWRWRSGP